MTTVILLIHVMIALALVGVVLLQRSEGGALGIGGGGGAGGGFMTGRSAGDALTRTTAILAACFFRHQPDAIDLGQPQFRHGPVDRADQRRRGRPFATGDPRPIDTGGTGSPVGSGSSLGPASPAIQLIPGESFSQEILRQDVSPGMFGLRADADSV
ncbi:MAG: hypothetical protein A49_19610 [Methyloceanibacter sp.]|nr:MAG: hypothetical protein A49_19610 [Methyloceanibacter sp.]